MRRHRDFWVVLALAAVIAGSGCGSTAPQVMLSAEERYAKAKALFDDGDYLDAVNEFTVLTLQYSGSSVAADAQFYLAESRFMREEYLVAAFEYGVVRRNYSASPRTAEAQYKLGLCYYYTTAPPALDQEFTRKAIDELQAFVEYYPAHPMATDAAAKINELNGRLAQKQYEVARLYRTMDYYKAALVSYDVVIEKFHDTEFAALAYIDKAEILFERDRLDEAMREVNRFMDRFPNSVLRGKMEDVKRDIERARQRAPSSAAAGPAGGS
jgi:outer membrane protein assembly factor BamD